MKKKKPNGYAALRKHVDVTLNLPINYRQLFKFTYRTNFMLIFKLSLILALFAIPLMLALYFRTFINTGIVKNSTNVSVVENIMAFQGWYGFVILGTFLIFSIGLCGVLYILKRQLKNDGVSFWRDFKAGIKKNIKGFLGITILYLGFLTVLNYALNLFHFKSEVNYYAILLVVFIIISILVFIQWTLAVMINMNYTCSFFMLMKSSFLICFARLPYMALSLLSSVTIFIVIWVIGYAPVLYAVFMIYIIIGFGHSALVISLFNFYCFDEIINKKQFPEAYRKGLFAGEQVQPIDEGFHK